MIVQIGEKKFRYSFKHIYRPEDLHYELLKRREEGGYLPRFVPAGITQVFIEDLTAKGADEEWQKLPPAGEAFCSELDNFNKEVGRKVALTKALKDLFPSSYETRAAFWDNYIHRGGANNDVSTTV